MSTKTPSGPASTLLLLGMHRSGTSALAELLVACGARVGDPSALLPAHPQDNPRGYFERKDVLLAHDRYLVAAASAWDRVSALPPLPVGDPALALQEALSGVLSSLAEVPVALIKDPRLCLLLPAWQALVPAATPVVAVRHPLELAASLRRTHRGTYPQAFVLLLWQAYMQRTLDALHGRPALFVDYVSLLSAPLEQTRRLVSALNAAGVPLHEPVARQLHQQLDPALRHHRLDELSGHMSESQASLHSWLQQASLAEGLVQVQGPGLPDPAPALQEFEESFSARVDTGRSQGRAEWHESAHALQLTVDELARWQQRSVVAMRVRLQEVQSDQTALHRGWQNDLDEARARTEELQADLDQVRGNLRISMAHAAALEQGMRDIHASWSWRLTAPLRLIGRLHIPGGLEQRLYRYYYRLPGVSGTSKRRLVNWLHERLPWLTRRTVSFQLHAAARRMPGPAAGQGWLRARDPQEAQEQVARLSCQPLVSIIMPVYNTDPGYLGEALSSVFAQSYPSWELCIADDGSDRPETRELLDGMADDPRVHQIRLAGNQGIAAASNAALALARGQHVAFLDHDDLLAPDALLESVLALQQQDADMVYTDEDKIDADGAHVEPHFKPDFSPDFFLSCNYVCHLTLIERDLVMRAGGFRDGYEGAQDYDLFLRCQEQARRIAHVPKVLYHWRQHDASTASATAAKPHSWSSGQRALEQALQRRGQEARVEQGPYSNTFRVRYPLRHEPLLSVIVPFRDQPELLPVCVRSVLELGGYGNLELLLVDNGSIRPETLAITDRVARSDSRIRVLRYDAPFNYSAINNWAVAQCHGEYLLLLNNDVQALNRSWIRALMEHAQRPDIGVVGARLLYPDNTVQHTGVIVGLGGVAGHANVLRSRNYPGYFGRAHLVHNVSAVTFACAMMPRKVYQQLGGLDDANLAVAFNDVDFCLRAREAGYLIVYTPHAELYHYESRSRGAEDTPAKLARFNREIAYMQARHADVLRAGDPFYNRNLSLQSDRAFEVSRHLAG